jgi:hypothetical protein
VLTTPFWVIPEFDDFVFCSIAHFQDPIIRRKQAEGRGFDPCGVRIIFLLTRSQRLSFSLALGTRV